MTLLDRFRAQARDKHSDPAVRLAFVEELPLTERDAIAAIAREDEDTRVRKAAVAKLMDPAALASIIATDQDEAVRAQAGSMLRDIALEAFEEVGEAESAQAIDAITDQKALVAVAKGAARESSASRALERVSEPHGLGSVARHAAIEAIRVRALDMLRALGQGDELLAVAMNSDFKDTALAALDGFTDRDTLERVIARGRNKSAVKRARAVIREADEQAARDAAAAALAAAAASAPVAVTEDASTTPPHGDPLATVALPADAVDAAPAASVPEEIAEDPETRAAREAAEQAALEQERERRTIRLGELATEAEAAVAEENLPAARKRFNAVRREWSDTASGVDISPEVLARYTDCATRMSARDAEAREADAKNRTEALARLHALLSRVEPLAASPDLTLKAADRALRDVKNTFGAMPPLPTKQDFEDVMRRLKDVQAALTPKVQELREADDWRRFANVAIQEQLCSRMEALRTVDDLDAAAREVRELQEQWRAAAEVPRAQADALWRRFKAAHDEVWARCEAHFAEQAVVRADNLAKKTALCEQAEALADSTDWVKTSEALKALQAEWKTIGAVSRGREKAIWERFRGACDRFFTRRHDDLAQRKSTWNENLARKEALCEKAEALASSTDWESSAAAIRALQVEWKAIGPVKKTRSEAIWQRFRGACDLFFQRYGSRHDTARAERAAQREALCVEVETLAAAPEGSEAPPDLLATARGIRSRWQQEVAARGVDPEQARVLEQRFALAFGTVINRWPAAFGGSDMDPESNRKKMEALVARVEALAESLAGPSKAAEADVSPTTRLAAMLKEALAANTIGGKADDDNRSRAAQEDVRQAQSAFTRLGPVPEEARRHLVDRFQRAVRKVNDRTSANRQPSR